MLIRVSLALDVLKRLAADRSVQSKLRKLEQRSCKGKHTSFNYVGLTTIKRQTIGGSYYDRILITCSLHKQDVIYHTFRALGGIPRTLQLKSLHTDSQRRPPTPILHLPYPR